MVNSELFENDEGEERPPDVRLARILATGFNYNFERAIADLIDNSIAADAKNVWIYIDPKNGEYESEMLLLLLLMMVMECQKPSLVKF